MTEREQLEQAIAALEAQRDALGSAVVATALLSLRERLAALTAQEQLHEPHRKHMTVLFADASGFTALSEKMDAEDVGDIMNTLWQRLDGAIIAHGGQIDKHAGDAVMAVWGAGKTREDDPERAIRAALAMQAALTAFREDRDVALSMRIGINTGLAIFGATGTTGEVTALGDAVNVASRLEQAAPVGGILVSHDTYRHVRGVFDVTPQAPLTVKGKREPVRTYIVQRAKPRAFHVATRGVEGIETRTIGREAEMQALQSAFEGVMQNAAARAVLVVGDPGLGKSRLAYEFENWIELLPLEVVAFKGRAVAEMTGVPYGLLRDVFRYRFEIFDDDSPGQVREKFEAGMSGRLPPEEAHLVGQLVGFDFSATTAVRNLMGGDSFARLALAYLTKYFRSVAAADPAVMLLEDLHWADNASLDFIARLMHELSNYRLLALCLARPTLFERRPKWGEGPTYVRLDLTPLSSKDAAALVGEILQKVEDLPDDLRRLIVNSAEGNPFYVEELIKMLVDDGVIVRGDEHWRVEMNRLRAIRVPPTLTGVLEARLDSLPHDERDVLQRASVVGRLFWDATVASLRAEGESPVNVPTTLKAVRARELVFRHERSAFVGAEEYLFKHALLRDVVYETVLLKLRRVYHRQVAAWLEANSGGRVGEFAGLIADHCERAGEAASAAQWWRRAGEAAEQTSAYREAVAAFERALALLSAEDRETRAELLVRIGNTHIRLSEYAAARERLEAGLAAAREARHLQTAVRALGGLGNAEYRLGDYESARAFAQEALALAQAAGDRAGEALALRGLGNVAYTQADYPASAQYLEKSLAICRETGDRWGIAACLNNLGLITSALGDNPATARYYEASLALFQELGDRYGTAVSLENLGTVARTQGDYTAAARHYEDSLMIRREINDGWGTAACLNDLGLVASARGDYAAATHYYAESLAIHRATGDRAGIAQSGTGLAFVAYLQGDYAAAARAYEESLEMFRELGNPMGASMCLTSLGLVCAAQGEYARAIQYHEASLALSKEIGNRWSVANSLTNLGHATAGSGAVEAARRYYREALAEALALEALPVVLEALAGMVALRAEARGPEATAELIGLALGHPASNSDVAKAAEPTLAALRAVLPGDELDSALARGKALDLRQAVEQVMAE
jgi:predicted ATPase/class 3 adenylate cyclase